MESVKQQDALKPQRSEETGEWDRWWLEEERNDKITTANAEHESRQREVDVT